MKRHLTALFLLPALATGAFAQDAALDLTRAVVLTPTKLSGPEEKAVAMLIDEVEKRTQIRWERVERIPNRAAAVVAVGRFGTHEFLTRTGLDGGDKPEGYRIWAARDRDFDFPTVCVAGHDARGVLFGVGYLLRKLEMSKHKVTLPAGIRVASVPRTKLRGHQLGYRPKTNSFDGWSLPMWEQYIRDLAVFGTNAIELIPPRSDDAADSPHFPLPPMEMMVGMSRLADQYGLDVWIWYPALDANYGNPETVAFALKEWGEVFKKLPRIDAVFVPGGDPGHTAPAKLMALLEMQTANLKKYHPRAQMWVSPQGFDKAWLDDFLAIVRTKPEWLSGIVHGPQVRVSLAHLRDAIPKSCTIRNYPDITHSLRCQYPVPDWDLAFAQTQGREGINPRPLDMAAIFAGTAPGTGFITYSEGCNDDVNKMIWSGLGWDPDADVLTMLRDYSRYFLGPRYADPFAQGLLALERNWKGPALTNAGIVTTLQQFQALEKTATPQDKLNWRFQQALYRAYYDAYVRSRLLCETQLEEQSMAKLRDAKAIGAALAMQEAEAILDRAVTHRTATDYRARVFELAEALYQSIRMQLSVERYKAISVGRGANLDSIDVPLNNRPWLKAQFVEIRKLDSEAARVARLDEIVNWTNPGPGGFYDDLGNAAHQPHLVFEPAQQVLEPRLPSKPRPPGYAADPEFRNVPLAHFEERPTARRSWLDQALALFDAPLTMHYQGLDARAQYKLKVVYGGGPIRLVANDNIEIHAGLTKTYQPIEFDIPPAATAGGKLTLTWTRSPGGGGSGRGCQVAEVSLMRTN
jgi:hypothetical protein